MKLKNNIISILAVALLLIVNACDNGIEPISDNIFFTGSADLTEKSLLAVSPDTSSVTTISVQIDAIKTTDVEFTVDVDTTLLDAYNEKYGSNFKPYPEHLLKFSSNTGVIPAGSVVANLGLEVLPADSTVDSNFQYAVPLRLESTDQTPLSSSDIHVIELKTPIEFNLPYFTSGSQLLADFSDNAISNFTQFTVEYNFITSNANRKNITTVFPMYNATSGTNKNIFYSRIQQNSSNPRKFMIKMNNQYLDGSALQVDEDIQDNTWYHIAIVYDGVDFTIYFNGVAKNSLKKEGKVLNCDAFNVGNIALSAAPIYGYVSEVRMWSVARSGDELTQNQYVVDPNSDNLELYWKFGEGSGTSIKDYSGHGRDGVMSKSTSWKTFYFTPN